MQARAVRTFTIAAWRLPVLAKWLTVLNGLGMLIMGGFMVVTPFRWRWAQSFWGLGDQS
jgi:hypothetical protein